MEYVHYLILKLSLCYISHLLNAVYLSLLFIKKFLHKEFLTLSIDVNENCHPPSNNASLLQFYVLQVQTCRSVVLVDIELTHIQTSRKDIMLVFYPRREKRFFSRLSKPNFKVLFKALLSHVEGLNL